MFATLPPPTVLTPGPQFLPWPSKCHLELPDGSLCLIAGGRALVSDGFVLGLALSSHHCVAVSRGPGRSHAAMLLEQAIGYLSAHAVQIVRVKQRCPIKWFDPIKQGFNWQRCAVFFTRTLIDIDPSGFPWPPSHIYPIAVRTNLYQGLRYWLKVNTLLNGLELADSNLLLEIGPMLTHRARRWESFITRLVLQMRKLQRFSEDVYALLGDCDLVFFNVVRRWLPAYEPHTETLARML